MQGIHVVLCYDVHETSRRSRLMRRLKKHLVHVQKSVFEGTIDPGQLQVVIMLVETTVDLALDTVRVYLLCSGCVDSTMLLGTAEPVGQDDNPRLF